MTTQPEGDLALWWQQFGGVPRLRPALCSSVETDVHIVGAGYTGLWAS